MSKWRRLVEISCPDCGAKRNAQARTRGTVRRCSSCALQLARSKKLWHSTGTLHQESHTPLYRVWSAMKQRCQCSTNQSFARYGGRGISVCVEWQEFLPFRVWAVANGYQKGLLLDREDNDGNYEPNNCRWATPKVSADNHPIHRDDYGRYAYL